MRLRFPFIWSRRKERHPLLVRNERFFSTFDLSQPVDTYDFVVFDTELTGLKPRRDDIVSIAGVRVRNLRIIVHDCFHSYVRPKIDQHTTGTFVHGITPEELRNAPDLGAVLEEFVDFCGNSVMVGHHVYIDTSFLWRAMRKTMGSVMNNPMIDSMQLAVHHRNYRKAAREYPDIADCSYNLAALSRAYRLPIFPQHDALQDALQTAYLFIFLVANLQDEVELKTLHQFLRAGQPPRSWL